MENPIMKKGKNGLKYSVATTIILNLIIYFIPNLEENIQNMMYIAINTCVGIVVGSTDIISDYIQAKTDEKKWKVDDKKYEIEVQELEETNEEAD